MADPILAFIGANNGYLPQTTKQVIGYMRDPSKFMINNYVQYVPSPLPTAYYEVLEKDAFIKLKGAESVVWAPDDYRPVDLNNRIRHRLLSADTIRYNHSWRLGYQTIRNTNLFDVQPAHMNMVLNQAMMQRYSDTWSVLETSSNYTTTGTAATYGGGYWDAGTATNPTFAKGIKKVVRAIQKATNSQVRLDDIMCILGADDAIAIGDSAEMRDYMKGSPDAKDYLKYSWGMVNDSYGLPPIYQGCKLIVENSIYVSGNPTTAGTNNLTPTDFKTAKTACFVSRVGGMDGVAGGTPFSSCQMYYFGKDTQKVAGGREVQVAAGADRFLEVKMIDKPDDELLEGHVTHQYVVKMVAPDSAAYITAIRA